MARWLLCLLIFATHFFLRDEYANRALSHQANTVLVYFLPETPLPKHFDASHPEWYEWLACGPHAKNTGPATRCAIRLHPGVSSVPSEALAQLQDVAGRNHWPVDAARLAFVTQQPDPSRDWLAMARLSAFDVVVAVLLAFASGWSPRQDARAAREVWKSHAWWWVLVPMAGGVAWSLATQTGVMPLTNGLVPREMLWPGLVSLAVIAPVYEEVVYRGWLYALRPTLPWWLFAPITAALFALSHGEVGLPTVYFFLSGLLLACVLLRTRSLLLTMLAHSLHNLGAAF